MMLELHDDAHRTNLVGVIRNIDHDYQVEEHVKRTSSMHDAKDVVKWTLKDDQGIRCVWERPVGSTEIPHITQRSARFIGEWEKGPKEVAS